MSKTAYNITLKVYVGVAVPLADAYQYRLAIKSNIKKQLADSCVSVWRGGDSADDCGVNHKSGTNTLSIAGGMGELGFAFLGQNL